MPKTKRAVAEPTKGKTKATRKLTDKTKTATLTPSVPTATTETKAPPNPLLALVDGFVRYYREGWRVGTLVEVTKHCTRIRPVGGKGGKEKDCLKIAFDDVRPIDAI